jgi:hypothetical protein
MPHCFGPVVVPLLFFKRSMSVKIHGNGRDLEVDGGSRGDTVMTSFHVIQQSQSPIYRKSYLIRGLFHGDRWRDESNVIWKGPTK